MKNKDYQEEIINYLYGEMNAEQRSAFEQKMDSDSALRDEVASLQKVRQNLGLMPDKEVEEPMLSFPYLKNKSTFNIWQWTKPLIAVAASLTLFLLAGYYTHFNITYNASGFYMGFARQNNEAAISKTDAETMIREALSNQQVLWKEEFDDTRDSLQTWYASLQNDKGSAGKSVMRQQGVLDNSKFQAQMASMQSANVALVKNYLTAANEQQQAYMQEVLEQFSEYMQQQRREDLLMIQENLVNLKTNQDQQQKETNQILADLMNTVSK